MTYFKTSDSIKIYYEVKGKGVPIIFIHGFTDSGDVFRIQKRNLSKKYKIVSYDIRGHGESDRVTFGLTMTRLSIDLKELIEHLEIDRVVIIAWSMGASVLFEYIKNFGTSKLYKICIVDKSPKMINDKNWDLGLYHGKYKIEDFIRDLEMIKKDFYGFCIKFVQNLSPKLSKVEFEIALEKISKNSQEVLYSLWLSMGENDYRAVLKSINIETLIVFGGESNLYSIKTAEYLKDNIKKSKLEIFPKSGHMLILENPRKFNKLIDSFIDKT